MHTQTLHWRADRAAFEGALERPEPSFLLYFGPNAQIGDPRFHDALTMLAPACPRLGCTTGTAISNGDLHDDAAIVIAAWLGAGTVRLACTEVSLDGSHETGAHLGRALARDDLAGVLVLCDSLNVEGTALVDGLRAHLPSGVAIAGGLASDGSAFQHTIVGGDCLPRPKLAAALGFYGQSVAMQCGSAHGWDVFGPPRRITGAEGVELHELDGSPALDLYERYLGDDAAELPASALRFPLLITNPADPTEQVVRTVLGVDRDRRSMTFASPIPQGWTARLMRGAFDRLVDGARAAGTQAARGMSDTGDGLAILVSCVGRQIVMGQETADEVEAVAAELPASMRTVGFYSHGEISTASGDTRCGLHNQTMTVVTIRDAA